MFLSKIEIVGFKSFAIKTTFHINGGITAIVGPNGCGKTNIVDAVRWVLGEQKTTLLRSEVMENVIFNGSTTRKPVGMAEVSITLLNEKQILPSQFTEVTITRRLYRDGKSEFYLNNNQCRLKDILELFIDTGIGNNSYSIIELKMIENLLNGSMEERRRLLEEAAGIVKYKQRKKETTKKLEVVHDDLLRIYDLVNEIEHQVRSLSRQASKTKKYNKIQQELRELELDYWLYQFRRSNELIEKFEEENKKYIQEKETKVNKINEIEEEIEKLESKIEKLENEIEDVRNEESIAFKQFSLIQNQIDLAEEKINSLETTIKRYNSEIEETRQLLKKFNNTYNELIKLKKVKEEELRNTEIEFNKFESSFKENEIGLRDKRDVLQGLREKIISLENEVKYEKLNVNKLISAKEQISSNRQKFLQLTDGISSDLREKIALIEKLRNDLEASQKFQGNLLQNIQEVETNIKLRQADLETYYNMKNDLQVQIKEAQTSLEFLKSILEVDESTRFLIQESDWKKGRKFFLLGEILSIDEQYRVAYDSILGEFKNVILVENLTDIKEAKEILSKEHKGKCLFICLDSIPKDTIEITRVEHPKIIGFASELPRVDPKLRAILRFILGNSVIAKDFADAMEIANEIPVQCVVTLSGELIWGRVIQKRGSILHREGLSIGKIDRIKKLDQKLGELVKEKGLVDNVILELEKQIKDSKESLKKLHSESKLLDDEITQKKIIINREELLLEQMKSELTSLKNSIENAEMEYNKYEEEIKLAKSLLDEKEAKCDELKLSLGHSENEFLEYQNRFKTEQEKVREIEKQLVQLRTELIALEKEIHRIEHSKNINHKKLEKLQSDVLSLLKEKENRTEQIKKLSNQREEYQSQLDEIKNRKGLLLQNQKELEEILSQQREYKEQIQENLEKIISKVHHNEVEIARNKEIAHSLFTKAIENYEVNLNDYILSSTLGNIETNQIEGKISELRKTLSSMGNVNFLALQEYEEQNARLELYKNQIEDLVKSEKSLKEALREINETAEKKFLDTFKLINENFCKVFKELFGGDSFAELVVDMDNPLDSDIEIKVKPLGKKINSIETLSQGEKTLTVLSLLFALYLVKPSPFCILDEVDAPLDDANVDRFLNLLKKFSNEVQFIIITHNKRTMEFADVLFGITMAEDGVSKVLSIKLVE